MKCSCWITFVLILSLSMSGVFASVSTTPMYATVESPTEDDEESPNTTEENVPETDDDDLPNNTSPEPPDGEEPCPEGQVTNPQTGECVSTLPEPCPEGQVTNPQTGECASPPSPPSPPININNNTVPNSTLPIIKGNCIAIATSEGVNASSAEACFCYIYQSTNQ